MASRMRSGVRFAGIRDDLATSPDHGDQRCFLLNNGYNGLRLNSAILESIDNGLLDFDLGTTSGANCPRVRNGDVAVDVYSLSRNGNEIAGADAALGGYEQSSGARLKNCYAENVSDAKPNVSWPAAIRKVGDQPGAALAKTVATLGVIRTKAYGMFLGSCCPPKHPSSTARSPASRRTRPPQGATPEVRSSQECPRCARLPFPPDPHISANDYGRSTNQLPGFFWKWPLSGH